MYLLLKVVIFHCYVSLPAGIHFLLFGATRFLEEHVTARSTSQMQALSLLSLQHLKSHQRWQISLEALRVREADFMTCDLFSKNCEIF